MTWHIPGKTLCDPKSTLRVPLSNMGESRSNIMTHCKIFLPVSLVVHNALRGVGERCERVHEFFVRVLHSSRVLNNLNSTNVFSCVGS